jgi:intraflagellar transport protein 80
VHSTSVVCIALSQGVPVAGAGAGGAFGSLAERRLALLDSSGDLYVMPVTGGAVARVGAAAAAGGAWPLPLKLAPMVDTFAWAETHDSLLALADGAALLWLWPHGATADAELSTAARMTLTTPQGALGSAPAALTYAGARAVFSRGDGARIFLAATPFAAPLHDAAAAGRWDDAVRLARLARNVHVWAALAALALAGRQLDAAEVALAAAGAIDKLHFVRHIKEQVRLRARAATQRRAGPPSHPRRRPCRGGHLRGG